MNFPSHPLFILFLGMNFFFSFLPIISGYIITYRGALQLGVFYRSCDCRFCQGIRLVIPFYSLIGSPTLKEIGPNFTYPVSRALETSLAAPVAF